MKTQIHVKQKCLNSMNEEKGVNGVICSTVLTLLGNE